MSTMLNLLELSMGILLMLLLIWGFDVWVKKRIRLYGIDAPETRTKDLDEKAQGLLTKERLSAILEASDGRFILSSHGVGKYGRCLGTLFIEKQNINELLVSEGLAERYL